MSEQEKKRQRICDLLNAEIKPKFLYLPYSKQRKKFFLQKKEEWRIEQKTKNVFFSNCSRNSD